MAQDPLSCDPRRSFRPLLSLAAGMMVSYGVSTMETKVDGPTRAGDVPAAPVPLPLAVPLLILMLKTQTETSEKNLRL